MKINAQKNLKALSSSPALALLPLRCAFLLFCVFACNRTLCSSVVNIAQMISQIRTRTSRLPGTALLYTHNATVPRSVYFRNVFRLIKSQWISFNKPVASLFPVQNRLPILQFVRQRLQICAQDSGHVRHPFASRRRRFKDVLQGFRRGNNHSIVREYCVSFSHSL